MNAQLGRHVLGKLPIAQQQQRLGTLALAPVLAPLDNALKPPALNTIELQNFASHDFVPSEKVSNVMLKPVSGVNNLL